MEGKYFVRKIDTEAIGARRAYASIPFVVVVAMFSVSLLLFTSTGISFSQDTAVAEIDYDPPEKVYVKKVFFVPKGEPLPTPQQKKRLKKHLEWTQRTYLKMLGGRDTFRIAPGPPDVYKGKQTINQYKTLPEQGAPEWTAELLEYYNRNRFNCNYVFLILVMNSHDAFPTGGGRSINGGFNTGGGIIIMSSRDLDKAPYFQSTLEHEIGHSFGLPHGDVYGYDMEKNDSLMSYNMDHRTNGFLPAKSLAILIPEDIRGLALNKRVFGKLLFDPAKDIPSGYFISPWMSTLGPMIIPGQPDSWIKASTSSGETYKSHIKEIAEQDWIIPTAPEMGFDYTRMWASDKSPDGWVSVDLTFPFAVNLNRIGVHSEHSGKYHPVKRIKIQVWDSDGYRDVYAQDINSVNDYVSFPFTNAQRWRLFFKAGESGYVVLRGLRYFSGKLELFPPLVPYVDPPSP